MGFTPRTVYVITCDGCAAVYRMPDLESDDDDFELELTDQHLDPAVARQMTADGWIAGGRHYCPRCADGVGHALVERLETEITHEPLFDLTDLDQARPSRDEETDH
ncbi:hypothetical protein [Streptomyces mirabilis]|uniref:hypothetical protein n=1 Tax=Streptomyces mirabilis TaxID=68239 RepID=UPI0036B63756